MKALLLTDRKRLEITEMPAPEIGAGDLLVRVKACGICGSDVHGYDGSTGRRIPPIVMGHEASGVVEQVGAGVRNFVAGDRVTFDSTVYCGTCDYCRAGRVNLCDNRRVLGVSCGDYRQYGCFAEFVAIPERIAYKLPDAVSFEHAAMVEPVSIAVHAVGRVPDIRGKSVVVVGAGMIGQLLIQVLRASGCGALLAADVDSGKLALARSAGADEAFDANDPDLLAAIQKRTDGRGAEVVFEAVGAAASFQSAIAATRKGGTVVLVGNVSPQVPLALQSVVTREISLLGSCASNGEYPTCLEMLASGKINVDGLISAVAPVEEGPQWFERLYNHEPGLTKIILRPN